MNCPIDNTTLNVVDREGVKIDYCPTCKGVWLDRGELEKIIELSAASMEKEEHPGYPDLLSKHTAEGKNYKGPGDNFLGRLFRM